MTALRRLAVVMSGEAWRFETGHVTAERYSLLVYATFGVSRGVVGRMSSMSG